MKREILLNIRMSKEEKHKLDSLSLSLNVSKSELIREGIKRINVDPEDYKRATLEDLQIDLDQVRKGQAYAKSEIKGLEHLLVRLKEDEGEVMRRKKMAERELRQIIKSKK
ncbi:ribbon-helix-helix protein, CopG family [Candidatus Marinimicrobia bacterium MT.SAG.2]|nr:ribbon-helix-helix protein, CopG family [Candidatus Marinimicrobia bacterium MT.SAG.2]